MDCQLNQLPTRNYTMTTDKKPFQAMPTQYRHKLPPASQTGLWHRMLRSYYLKSTLRSAKLRYAYSLAVVHSSSRIVLPKSVRSGLRRYAVTFARIKTVEGLVNLPLYAGTAVICLVALLVVGSDLANSMNIPEPFWVACTGFIVAIGLVAAASLVAPRILENALTFVIAVGLYCGAIYLLDPSLKHPWYSVLHPASPQSERLIAYGMLMGGTLITAVLIMALFVAVVEANTVGRLERQYPNVAVLDWLLRARRALAVHEVHLSDPTFKNYLSSVLERAAESHREQST